MLQLTHEDWCSELVLTRDLTTPGDRTQFFAAARRGEYTALVRGAYLPTALLTDLDADSIYLARLHAVAATQSIDLVFSHRSAAALWRLPWVGEWQSHAHVVVPPAAGGRSTTTIVRHTVGVPNDTVTIDDLVVTTLARTVADVAATASFGQAVALADAVLRRTMNPLQGLPHTAITRDELLAELVNIDQRHGSVRARRAIEFADPAADRPGESLSRVSIRLANLTMPQLQAQLTGASGRKYRVDFWWPEFNVIGEFDGKFKYSDPRFLRGRLPEQALYDEKLREDDLRAAGRGFTRWNWEKALSVRLLRTHLLAAGIR